MRTDAEARRDHRLTWHPAEASPTLRPEAGRATEEFRQSGGYRGRKYATAQRTARTHGRSYGVAGAADGDIRGAAGHLVVAGGTGAGV